MRSSFASENDITLFSVSQLPYMLACIDEGLRMYPPVPLGLPRVVPATGATVAGNFVPGGVRMLNMYACTSAYANPTRPSSAVVSGP